MKTKHITIFLFILLVLSSFAFAVAPVTTINTFTGDTGINVNVNIMPSYKHGEARFSIIFLSNASNGYEITNETHPNTNCIIHLRNSQGFKVMEVTATPHDNHFDLNGSGGGANPIGTYAWTIICNDNSSETGGTAFGLFEITNDGKSSGDNTGTADIAIMIFVLVIAMGFFAASLKTEWAKNIYTDLIIKRAFAVLGLYFMTLNAAIAATIAAESGLALTSEMFGYMFIIGWAGWLAMVFMVLKTLFDLFESWKGKKNEERFGS